MRKIFFAALTALIATAAMAETPLWLRYAKISPDGKQIAFCYKGDIYKVAASGGQAIQLTTKSSYEMNPVWSADGRYIAFASDRKGNFDVYVMPSEGGAPTQLTINSASELPWAFSPDGKYIYFSAAIQDPASSALFPSSRLTEVYKVPVAGGRTTQVLGTPAEEITFNKNGKFFVYQDQKGMEDAWRKHHTSSVTRDVWLYDTTNGKHVNLTNHAGEDRSPVLSADGSTVYILSERDGGSFNVYSFPINAPQSIKALTSFKKNPVRFLSIADNGTLCYTYDGEIYTQAPSGKPTKVKVALFHDDSDDVLRTSMTRGATAAVASPDGKQVAFIARGEVFVTSVEYATTKRITTTPEAEAGLSWGSDNRTLYYATERSGNWQLVKATIERKEDPNFPNATTIKEEILLPSSTVERAAPDVSPNGKKLAFIEDRNRLMVMDIESGKVHQVTDGSTWYETNGGFDYSWSPDSKWFTLTYIANQRDPYTDVGIVSADGGKITNITGSGYFSESPKWVMEGNAILFTSNRYGMRAHGSWGSQDDVLLAFVNQDAYDKYRMSKEDYELVKEAEKEAKKEADKKKAEEEKNNKKKDDKAAGEKKDEVKDIVVELDGIEDRVVRLTPNSSSIASAMVTNNGDNLYYLSKFESGYDLWKLDMRKHSTKLVNKMNSGWANIQMSKDGKEMFVLGSAMNKLTVASDKITPITYKAEVKMDLAAEREYMYNHVQHQVNKRFFRTDLNGCKWDMMCDTYRKFLPHINNNYDYANLLSELLGELNVSHSGSRYYPSNSSEATANMGLLFDWTYTGKGLKIDEVVEKGPFARSTSKVRPGMIVEKINGIEIDDENDYTQLLNGLAGKKTLVTLRDKGGNTFEEVILPITNGAMNNLLYKRWVKRNAHLVDSLSGGRLGYVHIQSMNDESYREVYSQVMGKYYKKDGIVIDIRFNGGGRLHEDIEVLFSGKKYFTQVIRGREACDMPSRRWNKPSIMVQCEACYSNAHGTPWVYKHTGIGKLVGAPVPGTMSSVSWETLQDSSLIYGMPIIGYRLPDGSYLENTQLEPDIKVLNDPAEVVNGVDTQLITATKELMKQIK